MKRFLKSDLALCIAFTLCLVGMAGITMACRTSIDNIDMTSLCSWWGIAMMGTIMIPFGKEF